jgi:WD40 repeat protein
VPDVFVSYSRRDSEFVRRLASSVSERGKDLWLDTEGIADAEVFPQAIRSAIEQSDAFLFVITPAAVESSYCENEVEYARELQKRIVPILREPVADPQLPAEIRDRNWIPFTDADEFDTSLDRLVGALDRDLERSKEHTRWLVKAIEWDGEGREKSFLLRGSELKAAEAWLAASPEDAEPAPMPLQREYLLASREAAARRQRSLVGASLAVALISIGLLVFALISRGQAVSAQTIAKSRALAAQSESQSTVDPQLGILLGIEAVKTSPTPQALFALRGALDTSPLRMTLPHPPLQCGFGGGPGLSYDPGAPRVAEALCNGELEIFDSASGRLLQRASVGGFASSVAYSADGSTLAVGTDRGVRIIDGLTGAPRASLAGGRVNSVALTPDGSIVAASSITGVGIWSIGHGAPRTLQGQHPSGALPPGGVPEATTVAFVGNGRYLLVGGGGPRPVRVFEVRTRRNVGTLAGTGYTAKVTTSPDGRLFAVTGSSQTGEGNATVWDAASRKRLYTLASFGGLEISTVAFSPDGSRIALGEADGTGGLWSTVTREQLASYLGPTSSVISMSFSPDGRYVAAASSDGSTNVWRASGPEETYIDTASASFGGGILAMNAHRVTVLTGSERGSLLRSWTLSGARTGTQLLIPPGAGAGLSPDGSLLATGGSAPGLSRARVGSGPPALELDIWNVAERRVIATVPTTVSIGPVAFSHDLRRVALFDAVQPAVADIRSGHRVIMARASPCQAGWRSQSFSTDGRLVAAADFCGNVTVWDAASGRLLSAFNEGGEVSSIAFAPKDAALLAVASWDSKITIWNVHTRTPARVLAGHTGGVSAIAYSPDGSLLASTSLDHTARVWAPSSGRLLRILKQPGPVFGVVFSPDGRTLATDDAKGIVRTWDACTACGNATALLALANQRATRQLTPLERSTFLGGF